VEALGNWVRANGLQKATGKVAMYLQNREQLDWKLLRDEIAKVGEEYPAITLKLVMSTPSTHKEWIEI